jgi:hypothetical protein
MPATSAQANEPVTIAGRSNPHPEARKLGIPDDVLTGFGRHFPASQIAVKECPVPGQKPLGDHMAIGTTGTAWQSLGIIANSGDQAAISSS